MHGDNLFQSPETREQLSPRTVPKNHRTDPFYSPGGHNDSAETSPYTSALFSPDDMMPSNNRDIQFESVDWATKPVARTDSKPRNITPTKELPGAETINLTPPMIQHQRPKPTHYSPPRILTRQQSPIDKSGLGIHMYDNEKSIPLDEKHPWEPTQPPPSHYVPYKEFEDVELNRPAYGRSQQTLPPYSQNREAPQARRVPAYYRDFSGRSWPLCVWIIFILFFLVIFVAMPLGIFGGVYHWNYGEYRCSRSWGKWDNDAKTCKY